MITIRKINPETDLSSILLLCKEFFTEYEAYHKEYFDIETLNDNDLSNRFIDSVNSDSGITFVALSNDKIVGYISMDIREHPHFYKIKKVGAIWGLMVESNFRQQGVASQLMAKAKEFFKTKGIKYFTLYTAVANSGAIEFYKKNGLKPLHISFVGEVSDG